MCGLKCEQCAKIVCPEHSHRTHSGRLLCASCQQKRKERKAQQKAAAEGRFDEELRGVAAEAEQEESIEERLLTASVKKPMEPWKVSVYIAGLGLFLMLVLIILPSWRRFPLPWGGFFYTSYAFMTIPLVSLFWTVLGFKGKDYIDDRPKCYIGIGVAVVACLLAVVAVFTDPARRLELNAQREEAARKAMTPNQLENWREQKLQKYAPPSAPKQR